MSSTKKKRKELASQLGEPKKRIEKWVNATELTKINGIEPGDIDHFLALKIASLDDLSKQTSQKLMDAMIDKGGLPESWELNIETVNHWIEEARNISPLIGD